MFVWFVLVRPYDVTYPQPCEHKLDNNYSSYIATCYSEYFIHLALTINFSHETYFVNENNVSVQAKLILSNPSSRNITVQIDTFDNNATGKLWMGTEFTYITNN